MQAEAGGTRADVMWQTDGAPRGVQRLWSSLALAFPETGLWPLVVEERHREEPHLAVAGDWREQAARDPADVLRELYARGVPIGLDGEPDPEDDKLAPFGAQFPPLAPGGAPRIEVAARGAIGAIERVAGLALVPADRPADVVASIGWLGPVNGMDVSEIAALSAALRSWEERYDAILVGLGDDTLYVAVRRPPRGEEACLAAAAELYAVCSDLIGPVAESLRDLAAQLDGSEGWAFWWD